MRRRIPHRLCAAAAVGSVLAVIGCSASAPPESNPQSTMTAFEGARVITGEDAPPLENATIIVDGTRILAVGPATSVTVTEGAKRVSLAGKTVMPAIVDTHTHLSQTREALTDDLKRRAYFGVVPR